MDTAVILGVLLVAIAVVIAAAVAAALTRAPRPGRPGAGAQRAAPAPDLKSEQAAELQPPRPAPGPEAAGPMAPGPTAPGPEARQDVQAGPAPAVAAIPARYHEDFMTLLVRDPWWLYAYWEVTPARELAVEGVIGAEAYAFADPVLRLHDETSGETWDIVITQDADNWYLNPARPDHDFVAELGRRSRAGEFYALLRSNRVHAPRDGPAEGEEGEWACPAELFARLYPSGYCRRIGTSSPGFEWVPRQVGAAAFSPGPWLSRR